MFHHQALLLVAFEGTTTCNIVYRMSQVTDDKAPTLRSVRSIGQRSREDKCNVYPILVCVRFNLIHVILPSLRFTRPAPRPRPPC
jgi:hypothetical protein